MGSAARPSLRDALVAGRGRLLAAGAAEDEVEAEIEAEVLLRHAIDPGREVTKAYLYARYGDEIAPDAARRYEALLSRRLSREPTAYITGHREFYGLDFLVTPDVLIPRPETELLVERTVSLVNNGRGFAEGAGAAHPSSTSGRADRPSTRLRIADVGTGSGAIAVALAKALPVAEVYAIDISRPALAVAGQNARRHGVERRVACRPGHLLTPLHDYVDIIVANLPYVTTDDWALLGPELREHEPRLALDGGSDGLDLIRELLLQAPRCLRSGGYLLLEIGEGQAGPIEAFAGERLSPDVTWTVADDFAGIPRVITAAWRFQSGGMRDK